MTVVNPGTPVPRCYEHTADVLVTYEGDCSGYFGVNPASGLNFEDPRWVPSDPDKFWHIVYDVSDDRVADVIAKSQTRHAGYLYVTDRQVAEPLRHRSDVLAGRAGQSRRWRRHVGTGAGVADRRTSAGRASQTHRPVFRLHQCHPALGWPRRKRQTTSSISTAGWSPSCPRHLRHTSPLVDCFPAEGITSSTWRRKVDLARSRLPATVRTH